MLCLNQLLYLCYTIISYIFIISLKTQEVTKSEGNWENLGEMTTKGIGFHESKDDDWGWFKFVKIVVDRKGKNLEDCSNSEKCEKINVTISIIHVFLSVFMFL